jgi:hypothetical protein
VRYTALLLVVALVGCGSVETKDEPKAHAVAADTPPPAMATTEIPDFGDPKPPVPAAAKETKDVESTRDALLHTGH